MPNWWQMEAAAVAARFRSDPARGLSSAEAGRRLKEHGPNELHAAAALSPWSVLAGQFKDFMVLVLLAAAAVSAILGERADAVAILAIVILNAVLGFFQEFRAERSLQALRALSAPLARVRRDGHLQVLPATEVVPGDLLVLEAGDRVPADARLLQAIQLETGEAALTGESMPVPKSTLALGRPNLSVGDRADMVFAGTTVQTGRGEALVIATGMATEIGQIAGLIKEADPGPTPLQQRLEAVGRWLLLICLGVCGAVAGAGVVRGEDLRTMFMAAVSLGVAAIPEGLPAVVTIALALGVQRMAKRSVIVRRLPAVETLGCATVICSDKTGTLTRNEMTVTQLIAAGQAYQVTGAGYSPEGRIISGNGQSVPPKPHPGSLAGAPALEAAILAGALCNNAELTEATKGKGREVNLEGDPTEGALLVLAAKAGLTLHKLGVAWPRLSEIPFTSERKRMSVVCRAPDGRLYLVTKGALDSVLPRCAKICAAEGPADLNPIRREELRRQADHLASRALRVLALAYRPVAEAESAGGALRDEGEHDLIMLGLAGMMDPPRPEAIKGIKACRRAGIRTIMITGDHPLTAAAVGQEIGLFSRADRLISGDELDRMSDAELAAQADRVKIYARVSPRHKLRIVRALKSLGHVVAMTGDGVNDAPAIKEADIGVAMGLSGTEVTKEAADVIILDDNFATIVAAVEEGRAIYDNIRKFIRYLLGCNTGEVLTMFLGTLLGLPLPLLPLQILWVNLVTDGLPALALGLEAAEPGVMARPPRPPKEGIFARGMWARIAWQGIAIGLCTLVSFGLVLAIGPGQLARARTVAFTVLVLSQLAFAMVCRSERATLREIGWAGNPYLLWTIGFSCLLQIAAIYLPPFARLFGTIPLGALDWLIAVGLTGWAILLGGALRPTHRLMRRLAYRRAGA